MVEGLMSSFSILQHSYTPLLPNRVFQDPLIIFDYPIIIHSAILLPVLYSAGQEKS